MVRLDALLLGYRIITAEEGYLHRLATHFLDLEISAYEHSEGFIIRESDFRRFKAYADGRIRYTASELLGLPGYLLRHRQYLPVLITMLLCFTLAIFLSGLVWDVRIVSEESVEEDYIVSVLDEIGFGEGTPWSTFNKEHVEAELLSRIRDLSWVSINRNGAVAYVEVQVREGGDTENESKYEVSNIVAAEDGVIDEIIVESGKAMVSVGDVVKKGDILISGIIDVEYGTILTAAKGKVVAHKSEELSLEVAREEKRIEYDASRVGAARVTIFGFDINIFKNYGNQTEDCVIIEEKQRATVLGKRLPLSLTLSFVASPYEVIDSYTDAELPVIAEKRLLNELSVLRDGADLIKLSTKGEYTEHGYRLTMKTVLAADIGVEVPITTD